jgi:hypothetical protein
MGLRVGRSLAASPACTFSVGLEGEAARVTDPPTLERVARRYREGGWPAEAETAGTPKRAGGRATASGARVPVTRNHRTPKLYNT